MWTNYFSGTSWMIASQRKVYDIQFSCYIIYSGVTTIAKSWVSWKIKRAGRCTKSPGCRFQRDRNAEFPQFSMTPTSLPYPAIVKIFSMSNPISVASTKPMWILAYPSLENPFIFQEPLPEEKNRAIWVF